jgi:hypothetical protein
MPPVPTPADLFRLEIVRFFRRGHRRTDIFIRGRSPPILRNRLRQQRRRLRARSQRRRASGKTKSDFHKMTTFHDSFPLHAWRVMREEFERVEMIGR